MHNIQLDGAEAPGLAAPDRPKSDEPPRLAGDEGFTENRIAVGPNFTTIGACLERGKSVPALSAALAEDGSLPRAFDSGAGPSVFPEVALEPLWQTGQSRQSSPVRSPTLGAGMVNCGVAAPEWPRRSRPLVDGCRRRTLAGRRCLKCARWARPCRTTSLRRAAPSPSCVARRAGGC